MRSNGTLRLLRAAALAAIGLASACAASLPTYRLEVAAPHQDALASLRRSLEAEGLACAVDDPKSGVLATTWRDSGQEVEISGFAGDDWPEVVAIYRRYRLVVVDAGSRSTAYLQVDARRCPDGLQPDQETIFGQCAESTKSDARRLRADLQRIAERLGKSSGYQVTALVTPGSSSLFTPF